MADLKKIKLPNNTELDIRDSRVTGVDSSPASGSDHVITSGGVYTAIKDTGFFFVQGSSSAAGNGTSGEYLSTKWEGTITGITTPTNGMKIAYRIATNAGVGTAGAVLSIDGGTTYKPVVFNVNTVISTRYGVGSTLLLTYNSTQTAVGYLTSNKKSTITGCWQIMDYSASNTDTKVRQYQSGDNAAGTSPEYPLLGRYAVTNVDGTYEANYARFHTGATLNTSTGAITATSFKKTSGTSSQFLKADGSVDSNTYLTSESDPVFSASAAAGISSSDITNWNGKTSNIGTITSVKMNGSTVASSGEADLGTVITSETSLSKGTTTGNGNAVTDISVSGHQITLTKGSTFLTTETPLSKGTTTGSGNAVTDISVSGHEITLTKGSTFLTSFTETDPVFAASAAHGISSSDITSWNGKVGSTDVTTIVLCASQSAYDGITTKDSSTLYLIPEYNVVQGR